MKPIASLLAALLWIGCFAAERRELPFSYSPFPETVLASDIWDVTTLGPADAMGVTTSIGASGTYSERIGDTSFLYLLRNDSLFYRGYTVGRGEGLLNDSLSAVATWPLRTDDVHANVFTQHGMNGGEEFATANTCESCVMATGRLVRSVGDTIAGVTLVREIHKVSGAYGEYTVTFHRWYPRDSRLPVAVQCATEADGYSASAFHLSTEPWITDGDDGNASPDIVSILAAAEVSVGASVVTIRIPSDTGLEIEAHLVDVAGHQYSHTRFTTDGSNIPVSLSVATLPRGSYMLIISATGTPVTEKRMLTL